VSVSNLGGSFGRIDAAGDASRDFDARDQGGT
jgi:hypothetical protein